MRWVTKNGKKNFARTLRFDTRVRLVAGLTTKLVIPCQPVHICRLMSLPRCLQGRILSYRRGQPLKTSRLNTPGFYLRPDQQSRVLRTSSAPPFAEVSNTTHIPSNRPVLSSSHLYISKHRPTMATITQTQTHGAAQTRSHGGHSHSHHHHDNTYLVSKNKNDAGVRITRIGLFSNLGMAVAKGFGGYLFNSQAMIADAWVRESG